MRDVDSATVAHLTARAGVVPRDLLYIRGKDRTTGAAAAVGFWNDLDTVTFSVISGETGLLESREYTGSGSLISADPIPLVADLTVRTINIRLSQINEAVLNAVRLYDARLAFVDFHRALFDPATRQLVAPPVPHFTGQVNLAPIETPPVGGEGEIVLSVVSHSRELTRTNPAKRSDETQKLRSGDRFRRYSSVAGQWDIWWGEKRSKVGSDDE